MNALVFLYKQVLKKELGIIDAVRALRPKRLPIVLTRDEVQKMLSLLSGFNHLIVSLLYGSRLRLMECLRLRVKDIDFGAKHIIVRDGKEFKDRVTVLPESVIPNLREHLVRIKVLHEYFLKNGYGDVELPFTLIHKYPNVAQQWGWQYVSQLGIFQPIRGQEPGEGIIFTKVYCSELLSER